MVGSGISVTATARGVVISITDELEFGRVRDRLGGAAPELVRAMEKIGKVIAEHEGSIVINGHTDARPFRTAKYDNWRLSTADPVGLLHARPFRPR